MKEELVATMMRLPQQLHSRLKVLAARKRVSMTELLKDFCERLLDLYENGEL
jgi:predicted DNA-binding protein